MSSRQHLQPDSDSRPGSHRLPAWLLTHSAVGAGLAHTWGACVSSRMLSQLPLCAHPVRGPRERRGRAVHTPGFVSPVPSPGTRARGAGSTSFCRPHSVWEGRTDKMQIGEQNPQELINTRVTHTGAADGGWGAASERVSANHTEFVRKTQDKAEDPEPLRASCGKANAHRSAGGSGLH